MSVTDQKVALIARLLTHEKLYPVTSADSVCAAADGKPPKNPVKECATGRWELTELEERIETETEVRIDLRPSREPLRSLLARGEILAFKGGRYTEYTTPVAGMTRLTLLDIARKAGEKVDPEHEAKKGSRSAEERRVEVISESQYQHVKTAVNRVGRYISGEKRDRRNEKLHPALAEIGPEYFVWDPDAGKMGKGDWRKLLQLVEEAAPKSSETQYKGSVRALMDLAATYKWVARTPLHEREYAPIPADWTSLYNQWREELRGQVDQLKTGLLALFETCHRHHQESPANADWESLIHRMEERFKANDVSSKKRSVIRRTYRVARAASLLTGPEWNGRRYWSRNAVSLVPLGDREKVAELYGQDGRQKGIQAAIQGELLPWPGRWEEFSGLVEGLYGLRRWIHYATVPASKAGDLDVPDRGLYPRDRIRGTSARSDQGWATSTVETALAQVSSFAGWIAREHGVDWSKADLRTMLCEDFLRGYKSFQEAERQVGLKTRIKRFGRLARLASPYLEWIAWEEEDAELADRMAHLSRLMSSPDAAVNGGKSWIARWKSQASSDRVEDLRRIAKRIERTWTRGGKAAPCAYWQLRRVLGGALELLEEDYGPIDAQVAAIRRGESQVEAAGRIYAKLDRVWAKRVRDVMYWADQVIVPLRVSTSVKLDHVDRREGASFNHLSAKIHRDKRKTNSPKWFKPNYCKTGRGYPVDLYRLYVMEGGARQRLLTHKDGQVVGADAHYVHDLQGRANTARMSTASFRRLTRRVVRELLDRRPAILSPDATPPITFEELNGPDHVLATHMFRHAYARYWVREQEDLHTASSYLDHSDKSMLLDVYLGEDESDLDPAGKMSDLPGW